MRARYLVIGLVVAVPEVTGVLIYQGNQTVTAGNGGPLTVLQTTTVAGATTSDPYGRDAGTSTGPVTTAEVGERPPTNIPMILAGGGAGHLKGGRRINFKAVPLANLHLTLMDQFGVRLDKMGDSTGRIDDKILSL